MPSLVKIISKDEGRAIEFIKICLRHDFNDRILLLRKKYQIDCYEAEHNERCSIRMMENEDVDVDIEKLLLELKIAKSFFFVVKDYLITNSINPFNSTNDEVLKNDRGLSVFLILKIHLIAKLMLVLKLFLMNLR